ncbi:hypothetical protein Alg130_10076 [Pyrenophora tritici-repentis]|nr:hypothetical protein Alg130_10076 [Pyrenophora tritici-repentis]
MEEATADTETMWPFQDDGGLTANAMSYVNDYLEANKCNSTLLYPDAPYLDMDGATVESWYAPATQRQQTGILPYSCTVPTATDELCFSVAETGSELVQTPSASCPLFWTDNEVCFGYDSISKTATTAILRERTQEPCFVTPDDLTPLSDAACEDFSNRIPDNIEVCVSPEDLILRGGRGRKAQQKHVRHVLYNYLRAEDEIALLSRRTHDGIKKTTRGKPSVNSVIRRKQHRR